MAEAGEVFDAQVNTVSVENVATSDNLHRGINASC